MKVMVTGSAGFIGSATAMRLLERGDTVVGIDNLNDYYDPASSSAPFRLYNIGAEKQVELMRCIEVLEECLGRKAQMEMLPLQPGDVPDTMADVSDLEADVGYSPRVTVEEGVRAFVDWYRGYMKT